ncbi:MAG: GntR family transcriptional regulator [Pseudomonadota bacterium]
MSNHPRYREIADAICEAIAEGRLPVGDKLPGEHELRQRFGVSRHTVREALRMLEERGMIGRHKGIGTVVRSAVPTPGYVQRMQSVSELLQYPADTGLTRLDTTNLVVSADLARATGLPQRSHWSRIRAVRRDNESGLALCLAEIYVPRRYRSADQYVGKDPRPLYEVIEEVFDEHIQTVEVEMKAETLDADVAELLEVPADSPSLTVLRRYHGRKNVFEVSVVRHPSERFTYSLTLHRDWSASP